MHFEIHAADTTRARRFYEGMFGWTFVQWPGAAMEYWVINTGSDDQPGINGGLVKRVGGEPLEQQPVNAFPCTIGPVADVHASVSAAVALGGSIAHPVMPVPGVGWLAYVKDTEGNIIGLMQADPATT
jgi:predicted enzyme related to lactoylglutathione lyase